MKIAKNGFKFGEGFTEKEKRAYDGNMGRTGRKRMRMRGKEKIEESTDEKAETEGDEDDEPGLHD